MQSAIWKSAAAKLARHILVATALLMNSGCAAAQDSASVHYRITIEVEDNGIIRSGSNVWQSHMAGSGVARGPMHPAGVSTLRGDAVPVEVPGRGTLFALLAERDREGAFAQPIALWQAPERLFGDLARRSRGEPRRHENKLDELRSIAAQIGAHGQLRCTGEYSPQRVDDVCPYFVTFRDNADPATVAAVDPLALDQTFGSGVRLRRILITIVDEPVSRNIDSILPWLVDRKDISIDGTRAVYDPHLVPLASRLRSTAFRQ